MATPVCWRMDSALARIWRRLIWTETWGLGVMMILSPGGDAPKAGDDRQHVARRLAEGEDARDAGLGVLLLLHDEEALLIGRGDGEAEALESVAEEFVAAASEVADVPELVVDVLVHDLMVDRQDDGIDAFAQRGETAVHVHHGDHWDGSRLGRRFGGGVGGVVIGLRRPGLARGEQGVPAVRHPPGHARGLGVSG